MCFTREIRQPLLQPIQNTKGRQEKMVDELGWKPMSPRLLNAWITFTILCSIPSIESFTRRLAVERRSNNKQCHHDSTTPTRRKICDGYCPYCSIGSVHCAHESAISSSIEMAKADKSLSSIPNELSRALEIVSIVTNDVLLPSSSSILRTGLSVLQSNTPPFSWDAFWLSNSSSGCIDSATTSISNAERVALALEKLGPTYVKFGQAAASRVDLLPVSLAYALSKLQDQMKPFDTSIGKEIIMSEWNKNGLPGNVTTAILESLSEEPVAAASVGQVYKGYVEGYGQVAVKVKRPGVKELVEADARLLRMLAKIVESVPSISLPALGGGQSGSTGHRTSARLIATEVVGAVDEFFSRLYEELDYRREAQNAAVFAKLYGAKGSKRKLLSRLSSSDTAEVVVPAILPHLCTDNVLTMEWVDGEKLVSLVPEGHRNTNDCNESKFDTASEHHTIQENLGLLKLGIKCTLSQLLETGILHADPHGGNLLKVSRGVDGHQKRKNDVNSSPSLAYLDFGLLAYIPERVRDGLVCAVSQLVFAKDVEAVVSLFGELLLLPEHVILDPVERAALTASLNVTARDVLHYTHDDAVPQLKFDKLLVSLALLVPRFQFQLPPYFLNNARALGTLEGMARSIDPQFNVLQMVYPYALDRLMRNPSGSPVVERTLYNLVKSDNVLGGVNWSKLGKIVREVSSFSGFSPVRVIRDIVKTKAGRRFLLRLFLEDINARMNLKTRTGGVANRIRTRRRQLSSFLAL